MSKIEGKKANNILKVNIYSETVLRINNWGKFLECCLNKPCLESYSEVHFHLWSYLKYKYMAGHSKDGLINQLNQWY